jgi:DNA-binding GntR family transcriptional regulator
MGILVKTLAEQTYEWVRGRILSGEMAPGFQVRQDVIAAELGCSKIPLREALTRLEQDGLLNSYPNRGYVVRPLSPDEASEVFTLRLKLEPEAMAEAARRATPEEREAALQAHLRLEDGDTSQAAYHLAHRAFHLTLIRPCGGLVTTQLLDRLHILAERYVRVHIQEEGREDRARREHSQMLKAWLNGDAERVRELVIQHLQTTKDDLEGELPVVEAVPA